MNEQTVTMTVEELCSVVRAMEDGRTRACAAGVFGRITRNQVSGFNGQQFLRQCGIGMLEKDGRKFVLINGKEVPIKR